jgi:large subunit ribosomal protein L21
MNPFAIVQTGGKQLRVEPSQVIDVERLRRDQSPKEVVLDKVLMVRKGEAFEIGSPFVKGASVLCEYLGENKGTKTISFKLRRRKNYRKKIGHRQIFTQLRVKEIQL